MSSLARLPSAASSPMPAPLPAVDSRSSSITFDSSRLQRHDSGPPRIMSRSGPRIRFVPPPRFIPYDSPSDDCSTCTDDDDDDDEDCTTQCHIDAGHCVSGGSSSDANPCNSSACLAVSCAQSSGYQTVLCRDEDCLEDDACLLRCLGLPCEDGECTEEPCDTCDTVGCTYACQSECPNSHCPEAASPDGSDGSHHCVDHHVNASSSNTWEYPLYAHDQHYTEVHPALPMSNSRSLPDQGVLLASAAERASPALEHSDSGMHLPPSAPSSPRRKRRRISPPLQSSSTASFEIDCSRTPLSMTHTPAVFPPELNFLCHWSDDNECLQSFLDRHTLAYHIGQDHIGQQIDNICLWNDCGLESHDAHSLFNHVRDTHVPIYRPQCVCLWAGCHMIYKTAAELRQHMEDHIAAADYCHWEACGMFTRTTQDMEAHVQAKHIPPATTTAPAQYLPSPKRTPDPPALPTEEAGQPKRTPDPPALPTEEAGQPQSLRCEWVERDGQGNTHICGLMFASPDELQTHGRTEHIAALKKKTGYYCSWAGCSRKDKQFSQKGKVERHLQTHTGYKSCVCEHCGKEFSAPQALQQHIRTHTGEKPYECNVCGKKFAQGSALTMHKRVHSGERPLKCDYPGCNKTFSESSNLSKHRKTHNPVGQHRCSFAGCTRSFHRLDQLRRHERSHAPAPAPTSAPASAPTSAPASASPYSQP